MENITDFEDCLNTIIWEYNDYIKSHTGKEVIDFIKSRSKILLSIAKYDEN